MKTYYYDVTGENTATSVFVRDAEVIRAGTTVSSMSPRHRNVVYQQMGVEYDIHFLFDDALPEISFYTVPQVDIFAVDCAGGFLGTLGRCTDFDSDAPICYIDNEQRCYLAAENGRALLTGKAAWKWELVPYEGIEVYASREEAEKAHEFLGKDHL